MKTNRIIKQCTTLASIAVIVSSMSVSNSASAWSLSTPDLWQVLAKNYSLVPKTLNARVQKQVDFLLKDKGYLEMVSRHAQPYLYYVYQQTQTKQIPADLALLPIVESDYYPYCLSSVQAEGIWQLMHATAGDMHIPMNWWFDGRRDLMDSTKGALSYLNYLHQEYRDWDLALAAYNAGEGTVNKAIKRNKTKHLPTDYWDLKLPKETEDYVPKLLATAYVLKNAQHYHLHLTSIPNAAAFTALPMSTPVNLQELAQLINVDSNTLLRLNPGFKRWMAPPDMHYNLLVPTDKVRAVLAALPTFTEDNLWWHYTVQPSDSLKHIAAEYHLSTSTIKHVNKMTDSHMPVGRTLLIPVDYSVNPHIVATAESVGPLLKLPTPGQAVTRSTYTVNGQDTLSGVANKLHVAPSNIIAWNQLPSATIHAGETLVIWTPRHMRFATHVRHHVAKGKKHSTAAKTQAFKKSTQPVAVSTHHQSGKKQPVHHSVQRQVVKHSKVHVPHKQSSTTLTHHPHVVRAHHVLHHPILDRLVHRIQDIKQHRAEARLHRANPHHVAVALNTVQLPSSPILPAMAANQQQLMVAPVIAASEKQMLLTDKSAMITTITTLPPYQSILTPKYQVMFDAVMQAAGALYQVFAVNVKAAYNVICNDWLT